jgi:hypothetical protein
VTVLSDLLSPDARQACVALGRATNWPAEEWAIALQILLDAGTPQQAMGLEALIRLTLAAARSPSEVAGRMVDEFRKASDMLPATTSP